MCFAAGRIMPATCVDHIEPHRRDYNKFCLGKLQSLCASCHSGAKRIVEQRGYDPAIGVDGMPLDPRHPVYRYR
jgi:5-methylcytosine-specific restriction protein A